MSLSSAGAGTGWQCPGVPAQALAFGTADAPACFVSDGTPMCVKPPMVVAAPLAGTASVTIPVGPF